MVIDFTVAFRNGILLSWAGHVCSHFCSRHTAFSSAFFFLFFLAFMKFYGTCTLTNNNATLTNNNANS